MNDCVVIYQFADDPFRWDLLWAPAAVAIVALSLAAYYRPRSENQRLWAFLLTLAAGGFGTYLFGHALYEYTVTVNEIRDAVSHDAVSVVGGPLTRFASKTRQTYVFEVEGMEFEGGGRIGFDPTERSIVTGRTYRVGYVRARGATYVVKVEECRPHAGT